MRRSAMILSALVLVGLLVCGRSAAAATPLTIELTPSASNPASPQMGDKLSFQTIIRNTGTDPVEGLIAWLSLVQIDKGQEQPVDLEDWSAHQAVSVASLAPGQGFVLQGASSDDYTGVAVSSAGDVNGDGFDDVNRAGFSGGFKA